MKIKPRYAYEGTCPSCKKRGKCHVEESGFYYEYGSIKSSTREFQIVSNCCSEPVDDVETFELEPEPDDFF